MQFKLKPIQHQNVVITGASSGIGLATAKAAASQGARVMLAARDEQALSRICDEIRKQGGSAEFCTTDVADEAQINRLAEETIKRFGGFDTWVNNAGVGLITTVEKMSSEDHQKIFQTNYFGVVHGSVAAVRHFRDVGKPAALINLGSAVSDVSIPLSVAYSATKHAIKGFTDGLRLELMQEDLPVSVTLIKPSAIDTRFFDHAKSEMGGVGKAPGPNYAPEVVADAILYAAQHRKRDIPVGATAAFMPAAASVAPGSIDKRQSQMSLFDLIDYGHMPEAESLDEVPQEGHERSRFGHGRGHSATTSYQTHPGTALGIVLAAGALVALLASSASRARGH